MANGSAAVDSITDRVSATRNASRRYGCADDGG